MAYLIFTTLKGKELARQSLRAPVVVGRAPDCDVCVHDILLSRRHCQFEPHGTGWMLIDLASKNGTYLTSPETGDRAVIRHSLDDGQTIRMGKTAVTFFAGTYKRSKRGGAAYHKPNKPRQRPSDPWSALQDTMTGFDYAKAVAEQRSQRIGARAPLADKPVMVDISDFPTPQPTPRDPSAYQSEDIYSLLTELASSSWDSIYMNASRPAPTRLAPRPMVSARHPRQRNASPVDLSPRITTGPGLLARPQSAPTTPPPPAPRKPPRWRRRF